MKERVITFRGVDHTLMIDGDGNWSLYLGGDNDPIDESTLTERELNWIYDYIYDWRAG